MRTLAFISLLALTACGDRPSPTQPSPVANTGPIILSLEAETGSGDGGSMQRSRASGGLTVHLAPGEFRQWTVVVDAAQAQYAVAVTYSNDNVGNTETLSILIDGTLFGALEARDTGDDGEGWNAFVTDFAGRVPLARGTHTIAIRSNGGDGCVEIDKVTLTP